MDTAPLQAQTFDEGGSGEAAMPMHALRGLRANSCGKERHGGGVNAGPPMASNS